MSDPYGQPYDPNRGYGQSGHPGGQGYPGPGGQGYPNQGYPNQGGYSEPGYGEPAYQDPRYGDQRYPDQGYQQPNYPQSPAGWGPPPPDQGGYQPYQQDPYGAPPPIKKKSKAPLIIGIIVLVVVVLCGGLVLIGVLASKDKTNTATTANSSTGATTGATSAAPPAVKISFNSPDRIGVLRKSSDQSRATTMKDGMRNAGLDDPFAVMYEDTTAKGKVAIAWGGTGSAFGGGGAQAQLDSFFGSAGGQLGGGTVGTRQDVDPGTIGGSAQCAKVDGTGVTMAMCAWAGDNALLGFIISGLTIEKTKDRMRGMLQAIVVKS